MPQTHSICKNTSQWTTCCVCTHFLTVNECCLHICRHQCHHVPPAASMPASQAPCWEGSGPYLKPGTNATEKSSLDQQHLDLSPLLFLHCGAFVGFSFGFNEVTVSRKGEKQREERRNPKEQGEAWLQIQKCNPRIKKPNRFSAPAAAWFPRKTKSRCFNLVFP